MRKLLHDTIRNDILIRLVLLDREFFSVSVIHELKQLGPESIVIAIAGNKSDLEDQRESGHGWKQRMYREPL